MSQYHWILPGFNRNAVVISRWKLLWFTLSCWLLLQLLLQFRLVVGSLYQILVAFTVCKKWALSGLTRGVEINFILPLFFLIKVEIFILIFRICWATLHNSGWKHSLWVGFFSPDFDHLKVCCSVWPDCFLSIYGQSRERGNFSSLLQRCVALWRCLWL